MKVIVLATDSASTWMLVNALKAEYSDIKVALEQPVSRWLLLKRRINRIGLWEVIGQVFFLIYSTLLRRSCRQQVAALIESAGLSSSKPVNLTVKYLDSVNSVACINWLVDEAPDVVVINGTRIVSTAILNCCEAVFLNTHCGITPAYRGVHGGYWALQQRDKDNAGVTVHIVDSGVDTGGILYQAVMEVDSNDNFITYPVKQYIFGIPLMKQALNDVADDNLRCISRHELPSAIWHHPTLWQYLKDRWSSGVC